MQCERQQAGTDVLRSRQITARGRSACVSDSPSQIELRELLVLAGTSETANRQNAHISKHYARLGAL